MAYENQIGIFMHQIYTSMTHNLQLKYIDSFEHVITHSVDQLVDMEMQRLRTYSVNEESFFIDQMLQQNPLTSEQYTSTNHVCKQSAAGSNEAYQLEVLLPQQFQRMNLRYRRRLSNRVKKAKSVYRHKFVSQKLAQKAHVLECIREVITRAETQLLNTGYPKKPLQTLRMAYGVDGCKEQLPALEQLADL